ncbi:MAG: hypothetical protein IPJ19_06525 [Planctomycetes bacterium]|nr:hypothetical protein [Planctomycetota bacterium]
MKNAHKLGTALALLALLVALFSARAGAASEEDPLAGARRRWAALDTRARAQLEERWQRYQSLPAEEQRALDLRAERIRELRQRAQERLAPELRARVERLTDDKREALLSELAENETARLGARLRAVLPPEAVQRLENARPEDRVRYFEKYQAQQRKRVTSYMLERLGARLGLAKDEIDGLKKLPEEQRTAQVLALRQRLAQVETREQGLPPGMTQAEWESWLALAPEAFFECLADHVRERQLAGEEAGISRGGARSSAPEGIAIERIRALRQLEQATQIAPADLVEFAEAAPEVRRERAEERARQRGLAILAGGGLASAEELAEYRRLSGAAFAGVVHELLAPLRTPWRAPAEKR